MIAISATCNHKSISCMHTVVVFIELNSVPIVLMEALATDNDLSHINLFFQELKF